MAELDWKGKKKDGPTAIFSSAGGGLITDKRQGAGCPPALR